MEIGIGNFIGVLVLVGIIGFIAGALVYRNNARKAEKALADTIEEMMALQRRFGGK